MIRFRFCVFFVAILAVLGTISAGAEHPGTWDRGPDMTVARGWVGSAVVDGQLYVIGGARGIWVLDSTVEAFDPVTQTWSTKAPMPTERCAFATATIDGKIYVFGGITGWYRSLATVEIYDPASDSWSIGTDMPAALGFAAAAVHDGLIYVMGGKPGGYMGSAVDTVSVYNPATDSWESAAPLAEPRDVCAAATLDGKIYLIGGRLRGQSTNLVERYDPSTDTWELMPPLQNVRCGPPTAAVIDDTIYVFGGNDADAGDKPVAWVEVLSPSTGRWQVRGQMPMPRCGIGGGVIDGLVYLAGGLIPNVLNWQRSMTVYHPDLYSYWADVAAHLSGSFGSVWRTDLAAVNTSDESAEVDLILHSPDTPGSLEVTVEAGSQLLIEDVVGAMGVTGKGTLELRSSQPLRVCGRTFTDEGSGTFGQMCDLTPSDAGLVAGDELWLSGLREQSGLFRTNLTFANTGLWTALLSVSLWSSDGTQLGSYPVVLQPGDVLQDLQPFAERAGAPDVGCGYAEVTVMTGRGVLVSASVVDSVSNDATTVKPVR